MTLDKIIGLLDKESGFYTSVNNIEKFWKDSDDFYESEDWNSLKDHGVVAFITTKKERLYLIIQLH